MMRILVVDDDKSLCCTIKRGLEENAFAVDYVHNGDDALYYASSTPYDLIILDVMMPLKSGFEVCRELRLKKDDTPVLMLTAKDEIEDRVTGLDLGADDYLIKPFDFSELLARIRALLRRKGKSRSPKLKIGDLSLNTVTREVRWKGNLVELTTKEFVILQYLMRNPDAVVTRSMIEAHAWDYDFDSISNLVDVYIRRIRQKIDPEAGKKIITTVRGAGYRMQKG
ncbi:MAG: response regulator transcription factor [Desulfobacula sp.]|jgi:DNA-binding response OmpR family regulator|nr:response regulator transcription factor [Desulfobacula sp.]